MSPLIPRSPTLASPVRQVVGDGSTYYAFPSIRLSLDGSKLYCVYKAGDHNAYPPQAVYFISRDVAFGSPWSTPVQVFAFDEVNGWAPADPDMIVTSTGRILVTTTFSNLEGTYYRRPHLAYSDDSGATWTVVGEVLSKFGLFDTPSKAVEIGGVVYLTHYGQEPGDSGYRVGFTTSADDGLTWAAGDLLWNGNLYHGRQFEEPGIRVLPGGAVAVAIRVDHHWQIMLTSADSICGTWRAPFGFATGCGKAEFGVFADGTMLFCQRWPQNSAGGWPVVFYTARLDGDSVIQVSRPAFLDPLSQLGATRRQMYAGIEPLNATTGIVLWSTDDGTFTGESTIYEAEVAI